MKPIITAVVAILLTLGLNASTLYEDVNDNVDPTYPTQPVAAFL